MGRLNCRRALGLRAVVGFWICLLSVGCCVAVGSEQLSTQHSELVLANILLYLILCTR